MRFTTTATALVALLIPTSVLASNTTATETLTSTVTRTLVLVNATTTVHMPTANWTSATVTGTSGVNPSYTSTTPGNYLGNGAGSDQSNLLIVGLAGAAVLAFGSL
jgi:hypothetical protein